MVSKQKSISNKPAPPSTFSTVAIVGLGLLGGALAMALKKYAPEVTVLGLARRRESIDQALAVQAIDDGSTEAEEILGRADLTVICLPINAGIAFCRRYARLWRPGAVVTDVGSTKAGMVTEVSPILAAGKVHFIGGHPMAGSEKSGFAAATAELYHRATVFLTPTADQDRDLIARTAAFWSRLGARPRLVDPALHDAVVARTSHLPHLLAPALLTVALGTDRQGYGATGGAFRDMTRIAASSPAMWLDIFQHNREEILAAVNEFREELERYTEALRTGRWQELQRLLEQARGRRREWAAGSGTTSQE